MGKKNIRSQFLVSVHWAYLSCQISLFVKFSLSDSILTSTKIYALFESFDKHTIDILDILLFFIIIIIIYYYFSLLLASNSLENHIKSLTFHS